MTASARDRISSAFLVSKPGSPGPAPTRYTFALSAGMTRLLRERWTQQGSSESMAWCRRGRDTGAKPVRFAGWTQYKHALMQLEVELSYGVNKRAQARLTTLGQKTGRYPHPGPQAPGG